MDDENFKQLLESVKQTDDIIQGSAMPARVASFNEAQVESGLKMYQIITSFYSCLWYKKTEKRSHILPLLKTAFCQ